MQSMEQAVDTSRVIFHLNDIINKRKLRGKEVADLTGLKPSTISDMRKRRRRLPSESSLIKLCDGLGVTVGELISVVPKNS